MNFSIFYIIIGLSFLGNLAVYKLRPELPDGTTFAIKDEFWFYEIHSGRPNWGKIHYAMSPPVKPGLDISKYKYIKTIPAGTRFEVVYTMLADYDRRFVYVVKPVSDSLPELGSPLIEIPIQSMIEEPYGKAGFWSRQKYHYRRLDMSLFTDFTYPNKE